MPSASARSFAGSSRSISPAGIVTFERDQIRHIKCRAYQLCSQTMRGYLLLAWVRCHRSSAEPVFYVLWTFRTAIIRNLGPRRRNPSGRGTAFFRRNPPRNDQQAYDWLTSLCLWLRHSFGILMRFIMPHSILIRPSSSMLHLPLCLGIKKSLAVWRGMYSLPQGLFALRVPVTLNGLGRNGKAVGAWLELKS